MKHADAFYPSANLDRYDIIIILIILSSIIKRDPKTVSPFLIYIFIYYTRLYRSTTCINNIVK